MCLRLGDEYTHSLSLSVCYFLGFAVFFILECMCVCVCVLVCRYDFEN